MTLVYLGEIDVRTLGWWLWFDESAADYDAACLELARMLREDEPDYAKIDQFLPTYARLAARFEARLTAYNAYMEYRATH